METSKDPLAELDTLVKALSEMAEPHGYAVEAALDRCTALGIKKFGSERLSALCLTFPKSDGLLFPGREFPDEGSSAAALVSEYGSRPAWEASIPDRWKTLRFPGGSPEELALKAAAGVKAEMLDC